METLALAPSQAKASAILLASVSSLLGFVPGSSSAMTSSFRIVDSAPNSWVARGYRDYMVTPANCWTFTSRVTRNFVTIRLDGEALPGTNVSYWDMTFAAPFGERITPGHYPDLQRHPFQDDHRPGLSFSSTGRLDNSAGGFFDVLEARYGPKGDVESFSVNFTHHGERQPDRFAIVELRYNVTLAPQPFTILSISRTPDGTRLTIPSTCGERTGIEFSPDLAAGSWIDLGNFYDADGVGVFTDPDPIRPTLPSGFYRAFRRPGVP